MTYNPRDYWSEVANRINRREQYNVVAGDDEPFYRHKRIQFLKLLDTVDTKNRSILEVGCGPGGNLIHLLNKEQNFKSLVGSDISIDMVNLAKINTDNKIDIIHFNGTEIPLQSNEVELSFTATVLQHNTDQTMLVKLIADVCRITKQEIVIFERVEKKRKGDDLCIGRTLEEYKKLFSENGFRYLDHKFIDIQLSYLICGAIRKILNSKNRKEGEKLNSFSIFLQKITLPFTSRIDKIINAERDLCMIRFVKVV
jgi:ubiquinone/menaquinone biosynthesis C-methylase UbiE